MTDCDMVICCRDEHRFSLLHWASMMGRYNIVEMLVSRGVRINATNMGDDTALHLAAAHNHRDIVFLVCKLYNCFNSPHFGSNKLKTTVKW